MNLKKKKRDPERCGYLGFLWKRDVTKNKLYNTVWVCCGRPGVWMCPNALHMSGSSAGPGYLSGARVDQLQAEPMFASVVVLL